MTAIKEESTTLRSWGQGQPLYFPSAWHMKVPFAPSFCGPGETVAQSREAPRHPVYQRGLGRAGDKPALCPDTEENRKCQ